MYLVIVTIFLALLQINSYTDSFILKIIPIGCYLLLCFKFLFVKKGFSIIQFLSKNFLFLFFVLIVILNLFRNNNPIFSVSFLINRALSLFLFIVGVCSAFVYFRRKRQYSTVDIIAKFILLPFLFFAILNLILWFSGIQIKESVVTTNVVNNSAIILSYIGININRVQFPLAAGFNNYAVIIGALFTVSLILKFIVKSNKYSLLCNISLVVFLSSLLLIDSRASLIYPALITFLFKLYYESSIFQKMMPYIVSLLIIGPLILIFVTPLLANFEFIENLARNKEDLATGNERFFIWAICMNEFLDFQNIHLIGYGDYGHFGSGASVLWSSIFNTFTDSEMKTPHNSLFGLIFDYGYFGVLVYISLCYKLLKNNFLNCTNDLLGCTIIAGFFLFHFLVGITETLVGFYFPNYFLLFLLLVICSLTKGYINPSKSVS